MELLEKIQPKIIFLDWLFLSNLVGLVIVEVIKMENDDNKNVDSSKFQKEKIKNLNKFFMRNVFISGVLALMTFIMSIVMLIILLNIDGLDEALKISLISMIATFIITTGKTLIDKFIAILQYLTNLLSEEQRGLNKNIGVDIDKVEFDDSNQNQDD